MKPWDPFWPNSGSDPLPCSGPLACPSLGKIQRQELEDVIGRQEDQRADIFNCIMISSVLVVLGKMRPAAFRMDDVGMGELYFPR